MMESVDRPAANRPEDTAVTDIAPAADVPRFGTGDAIDGFGRRSLDLPDLPAHLRAAGVLSGGTACSIQPARPAADSLPSSSSESQAERTPKSWLCGRKRGSSLFRGVGA